MTDLERIELLERVVEVRLCAVCWAPFPAVKARNAETCSANCKQRNYQRKQKQ